MQQTVAQQQHQDQHQDQAALPRLQHDLPAQPQQVFLVNKCISALS